MTDQLHEIMRSGLTAVGFRPRRDRLAVAFSGGRDSTALLVLAVELLGADRVLAIHVDHAVRPESASDAEHARSVAERLGATFVLRRLDPEAVEQLADDHGPEGALRELRYTALIEACQAHRTAYLALGHHAGDALEGHLLALLRGSGLVGLGGPRPWRRIGDVIAVRPLIDVAPAQLEGVLTRRSPPVDWVEDASNQDVRFPRNRIRHEVIPTLLELAGGGSGLYRAVTTLREDREALDDLVGHELSARGLECQGDVLDLSKADHAPTRVVVEAIRRYIASQGRGCPPSRAHVERIRQALAEPGRTRWLDLPGMRLIVEGGRIRRHDAPSPPPPVRELGVGQAVSAPEMAVQVTAELVTPASPPVIDLADSRELFDWGALEPQADESLVVRGAHAGDRFRPFGLTGSVRLMRWLAGRGIARTRRPFVPVVALGQRVLWVVGHRRSAIAPLAASTTRCLRLTATQYPDPLDLIRGRV